jgi:hypothetical protein
VAQTGFERLLPATISLAKCIELDTLNQHSRYLNTVYVY